MLNDRLMMLHSEFATKILETTMKNTLEMYLYQTSVIFGHVHKSGQRWWRGLHFNVQAVSAPCLCRLDPHYNNRTENWQQGIVFTEYDPNGSWHDNTIIDFTRRNGSLVGQWGDREYSVKMPTRVGV